MVNKKNGKLVQEFEKLVTQIKVEIDVSPSTEIKNKHMFRLKQISNVLNIIRKYPHEIKSGDDLKYVKGVGPGTIRRIDEILSKGKLSEIKIKKKDQNYANIVDELQTVHGIGQTKAYELITKHGIKSVQDLKKAHKKEEVELNDIILTGLKYHNVYQKKIPRKETNAIKKYLNKIVSKIDSDLTVTFCGSYRREKPLSNDIDILLTHNKVSTSKDIKTKPNNLIKLVKVLKKNRFIVDDLTNKNYQAKYMGYCRLINNPVRRVDIRYVPYESYYTALMYFTGSGAFNRRVRALAESLGYMLNEYGLYKLDKNTLRKKKMKIKSEKDIFEILGLEYLSPNKRI